jgi:hypothetical protein
LADVIHALYRPGLRAGRRQRGQQHRNENRDDSDDDQKLNEREGWRYGPGVPNAVHLKSATPRSDK